MAHAIANSTWRYAFGPIGDRIREAQRHAVCNYCNRKVYPEKPVVRGSYYYHGAHADVGALAQRAKELSAKTPAAFARLRWARAAIARAKRSIR